MEDIQKIISLDKDGKPEKVFIFNSIDKNIDISSSVFSDSEKLYLDKYKPDIVNTSQHIHKDDSIRTIKRKFIKEVGYNNISYEELYIFGKKKMKFQFPVEFEHLQASKSGVTKIALGQLIMNLQITDEDGIKNLHNMNKDLYSYKDIENELKLDQRTVDCNISVGHKFAAYNDYLFSGNPYNNLPTTEPIFKMDIENMLFTFENHLLLSYGEIEDNTLYMCSATNVLTHFNSKNIDNKRMIQIYFPLLSKKDIHSLNELQESKITLLTETKKMFEKISDDRIDALYEIHTIDNDNMRIPYVEKGIKTFSLILHPKSKTLIPLENIFKQIHTDETLPFMKFKPGFKKEELYRLYSVGVSNNGKKIPYLSKSQINMFSKKIPGAHKHISFCIVKEFMDEDIFIFCSINNNGDITIDISLSVPVTIQSIEKMSIETLNSLIAKINPFLTLNKRFNEVLSFNNQFIEFNKIDYITSIQVSENIKTRDFTMFTSAFNIIEMKNNDASLRYKRVENYKEMNEINSMINKMYKQNTNINSIVNLISVNFSLSEEDARMHITNYLNEYTLLNGNYVNKNIDVADNPGFPTLVHYDDIQNKLSISVNDVDSIHYIPILNIYIDALVKSTIFSERLNINNHLLEILKKSVSKNKQDIETENVVAVETDETKSYRPNVTGIIQELREDADEEDGIFFDEDEDEFEDEGEDEGEDEAQDEDEDEADAKDEAEDEDEDEDDNESIDLFTGGAKKEKSSGTFFYNKLKKLEPALFKEDSDGEYARICPAQSNRQPVILTEEEKQLIDQDPEAKSAYGIAIKYGTNPNKPHWYMCPRYWCLKTNKPMTEEQVKNGECGGKIIPQRERTKAPPGHYIYEFTDDRQHTDSEGNYTHYNPGFLDKSKSADNIGIPCCFRNPFSTKQNTRREELGINEEDIHYGNKDFITGEKSDKTTISRNYLNVLSIERTPVQQHRWGFLPISVELFLHTNNSASTDKSNSTYIRKGETPLLRYGVEKSSKQSFIACIADIYTFHHDINVPSIKEMREIISQNISLDLYLKAHNGSLVSLFQPKRINITDIDVEKYRNTLFYKSIDLSNQSQNNFLKFTISSYEKFLEFLKDDDSIIDHTILWDIISSPSKGLFEKGINIVIMEIEDNDIRDNISLICPTNSYSDTLYDSNKGTILLLKHGYFYEPIYIYGNTRNEKASNKLNAIKIFYNENTPPNLTSVMKNIENSISNYCKPADKPKTYIYKNNISAIQIKELLDSINVIIHKQVLNYRGKIIGFMVSDTQESTKHLYLPTAPSSKLDSLDAIYADEIEWLDYSTTLTMLNSIYTKSNQQIFCKPLVKVEEDGLIVGFITETNQFISINKPEQNLREDGLKTIETIGYGNYYNADNIITTTYEVDEIRRQTVRNIKLETKFYRQFREKLRDEISNLMNQEYVTQLEVLSNTNQYVYSIKLEKALQLIKAILGDSVNFVEVSEDILNNLDENNDIDWENKNGLCLMKDNELCIPSANLITNEDNEQLYYYRISDELIRYSRVRRYILDSSYLKLENLNYDLKPNELLLLNTHVTGNYFDDISYKLNNTYIENIPYELAQPMNNKLFAKRISLEQQNDDIDISSWENFDKECISKTVKINKKDNWNKLFSNEYEEIILKNTPLCSYYIIAYVLKLHANIEENIHGIKKILYKAYDELMKLQTLQPSIHTILAKQFKKNFIEKIRKNQLSFETMIMNDNYIITQLDLWVICHHLNLPVVLFSKVPYSTMKLQTTYIILGGNTETDDYIFIRSNPYKMSDDYAPNFSIVKPTIKIRDIKDIIMLKTNLPDHLLGYKLNLKIKT